MTIRDLINHVLDLTLYDIFFIIVIVVILYYVSFIFTWIGWTGADKYFHKFRETNNLLKKLYYFIIILCVGCLVIFSASIIWILIEQYFLN